MSADMLPMAVDGALTSVVAPGLVLVRRPGWDWDRLALPAVVILPLFVVAHAAITLSMVVADPGPALMIVLRGLLLVGAVLFWLPVFGHRRRLSDPGRTAYLFLATPALDLAAVWIIARGDSPGGLAMIVAMLPIGLTAVVITWRWIVREERLTPPGGEAA